MKRIAFQEVFGVASGLLGGARAAPVATHG
jgi:hypothetical protein